MDWLVVTALRFVLGRQQVKDPVRIRSLVRGRLRRERCLESCTNAVVEYGSRP